MSATTETTVSWDGEKFDPPGILLCEWFALCDRPAETVREHSAIGPVPICGRCSARIARLEAEAGA